MRQIKFVFLATLMLFAVNVFAADANDAKNLVKDTTDKVLQALKADPSQVINLVDEIVLPHFDFVKMSQLVLSKHWRAADDGQKVRFVRAFRELLVRTYANALVETAKGNVTVDYDEPVNAGIKRCPECITLKSTVNQVGKEPINVDYAMYVDEEEHWKIYNVYVGGVSLVINYRNEFANDVSKMGIEKFIVKLETSNKEKRDK